jgi:hypothetical protein
MAMSIVQTVDKSVEAYIRKISEEQANVDACAHLIDTECRFGYFIVLQTKLTYLYRSTERKGWSPESSKEP